MPPAYFELVSEIDSVETIAVGRRIRELGALQAEFGVGRWRKLKGIALVRLANGHVYLAEIHWYEAHGIGRRKLKIKQILERR